MDVQVDRLSSLSDDLIHLILSFIDVKYAIQTTALSSRYRFIWTSLPYLSFSNYDSSMLTHFSKFVTHVLCRRDTQIEVYSVKLSFHGNFGRKSVKSILDYAFSHNVQQMIVTIFYWFSDDTQIEFPLSLFNSASLKHLTLSGYTHGQSVKTTSTWDLPALTTLHLQCIRFDHEVLTELSSKCSNLKNLTLNEWRINYCNKRGCSDVDIYHARLSNLTLVKGFDVLNVVTPQLKNLTIKDCYQVHLTSAPKLESLVFEGYHILQHSPNGLCSLEKADLCFYEDGYQQLDETYAHKVVDLLQQIRCVKYLTLNTESIQLLSSFKELISHRPSPFANLRSLKVYPHNAWSEMEETMPIELKNYFLQSSSGAIFTMASCKEIISLQNAVDAQNLMGELRVILEDEKSNSETSTLSPVESHDSEMHEKRESQVENEMTQPVKKMPLHIEGGVAKKKICWEDLDTQIDQGRARTRYIISMLRRIEKLILKDLPTSKRDKLQARFSSLEAEVATVVKNIIDRMKLQCDWVHELATTS